ncbi:MAG: metallophosphoesterase [Candidatus Nanohaloarchaea archaeon]
MQVLLLSDIHGDTDTLQRVLDRTHGNDLVLVLGDLTDMSVDDPVGRAREVVELLDEQGTFVKAVPGNMDGEDVLELLVGRRVNLHKDLFTLEDTDFVGFGGGRSPADTPFEPDDAERGKVLRQLLERTRADRRAVVSHEPPRGTTADRLPSGEHVGSPALRELVEDVDVDMVLSGHVHEGHGTDRIGDTLVVNPGAVQDGRYAIMTVEGDIDVELHG